MHNGLFDQLRLKSNTLTGTFQLRDNIGQQSKKFSVAFFYANWRGCYGNF